MEKFGLGAVAILDVLGFRGIWQRESPKSVISRMKSLRSRALNLVGADRNGVLLYDPTLVHRVICVSDSLIISVMLKSGNTLARRHLYRSLHSVSLIAFSIVRDAIGGTPPLLLRGAIATGEMLVDSGVMIGPAIDEAAEYCDRADGPFVSLTPSAVDICEKYSITYCDKIRPHLLLPYDVPRHDGSTWRTLTLGYCRGRGDEAGTQGMVDKLVGAFGTEPLRQDVEKKRKHAIAFIRHLDGFRKSGGWQNVDFEVRLPKWTDLSPAEKFGMLFFDQDIALRMMNESRYGHE